MAGIGDTYYTTPRVCISRDCAHIALGRHQQYVILRVYIKTDSIDGIFLSFSSCDWSPVGARQNLADCTLTGPSVRQQRIFMCEHQPSKKKGACTYHTVSRVTQQLETGMARMEDERTCGRDKEKPSIQLRRFRQPRNGKRESNTFLQLAIVAYVRILCLDLLPRPARRSG